MAAALATQGVSHRCHTRAITMSCHRHQRPVAAAMRSKSGFSNTSTTGWRRVGECCCCCCHGRDGRRAAGRYSASRWTPPPTSEKGEEEDDGSIELDAEEAVPGIEMPSAGGVFEPDREDNMPRMPPSDIHLQSPRQWSPISFAFLGDAVWELYIRRLFFAPPSRPLEYDLKCKRAVKAEAQDGVLRHLVDAEFFSPEELGILKWGRNASYGNTPQRLRGKGKGGFAIYRNASALECVVGYLYMTDLARLEEMMAGLGSDGVLEKIAAEGTKGGAGKGMVTGGMGKPKK